MVATAKNTTLQLEVPRDYWRRPMARIARRMARVARGRRLRTRLQFATECIVLPNEGPHKNENWRPQFQPYTAVVLDLMDRSPLRKYRFTGCVQSGKSFVGVICVLWHLFERGENVGYAVPDIDQSARDKWQQEFLPVIMASPELRKYLPDSGEGSQGGTPTLIKFKNGASLRFIPGCGKDHHQSNFTVDVVFKTEVDRYDVSSDGSRETSPPERIENRIEASGDFGFSYEECTVTDESGRIWTELSESTNHRLHVKCVHCSEVVCPGRDDLVNIEDAADMRAAEELGSFRCPACEQPWTENDRRKMLESLIPVGEGQTARIGTDGCALVEGDLKPTDRLGFSWCAFHNRFWTTAKICRDEYLALFSKNQESLELKRKQHAWTTPPPPDVFAVTQLTMQDIMDRAAPKDATDKDWRRLIRLGWAPPGTLGIVAGVDVGKRWLHFVVRAFYQTTAGINSRIIDIGTHPVRTDEIGIQQALPEAVLALDERFSAGYPVFSDDEAGRLPVRMRGIDGGWQGTEIGQRQEYLVWESLLRLVQQGRKGWLMTLGRGQSEPPGKGAYSHPKQTGKEVLWIGEQCHIRRSTKFMANFAEIGAPQSAAYCIINSDVYKDLLRTGYVDAPIEQDGAVLSFNATTKEERALLREYAQHIRAETRKRKPVQRRGTVVVYENESKRPCHLGDADYVSMAIAGVAGLPVSVRVGVSEKTPQSQEEANHLTMPDGRAFMAV